MPPSGRPATLFSEHDISRAVGSKAAQAGRSYQTLRQVRALDVIDGGGQIIAQVKGGSAKPYRQIIRIHSGPSGQIAIAGDCSCPVGHNCKHVAAALFETLQRNAQFEVSQSPPKPSPKTAALPYELDRWLESIAQATDSDAYPSDVAQRLLYVLKPYIVGGRTAQIAAELMTSRLLVSGALSPSPQRASLQNLFHGVMPRHFRPIDIANAKALVAVGQSHSGGTYNVRDLDLLKRIVSTGRAYWQTTKGDALHWGSPREGRIDWVLKDTRGQGPELSVEGAIALNANPPVYVDSETSEMGEVSLGCDSRLAFHLLDAPVIAPDHIAAVRKALSAHIPETSHLIPNPPEPAIKINDDPVPILHLQRAKALRSYSYGYGGHVPEVMAVASLEFRYGPLSVGQTSPSLMIEGLHQGRLYEVVRRPNLEVEALKLLEDTEFEPAREVYPLIHDTHYADYAMEDAVAWLEFLSRDVPRLEKLGFEFKIDKNFPYLLARPSSPFEAEVFEGSGIDWFELAMGVEIDGERQDLGPLLANLVASDGFNADVIRSVAEDDGDLYLPLADGRYIALAAQRFLPLILALHDWQLNGFRFSKDGRLRLTKANGALLDLHDGEGLVFKGMEGLRAMAHALNAPQGLADVRVPDDFKAVLRPYQAQGLAWLNLLSQVGLGGILADDMGLGKTVQILALLSLEKAHGRMTRPCLILAPTSLMTNWQNEAEKFAPDLKVLTLHGADRKARFEEIAAHDIVLSTYPLIARDHATLLQQDWHMAILDEAQTIKNPNAATTRLIHGLKATHRFCLTGTPMENHLGELWSLMNFVNPGYLGDKTAFARNFRTPIEKRGDTERAALLARRVKPFMLRRTKAEVAADLPPKSEIIEAVTLEGQQRDIYDSIRLSMHKKVRDAIATKGLAKSHIIILEALLKLRQACCDPRLLRLADAPDAPSAKLERLMEMVNALLAEGRKTIIFSQFTSMLDLIVTRFKSADIAYSLLTGETKNRKAEIDDFQSGKTDIFLISLKAGGVGLNLTAADTVILYDPWWNPAVEEQAIDRAYRIGQDKPVFVYRLTATGTIEDKMDGLKARKRELANGLFDQAQQPTLGLSEADLDALFTE